MGWHLQSLKIFAIASGTSRRREVESEGEMVDVTQVEEEVYNK